MKLLLMKGLSRNLIVSLRKFSVQVGKGPPNPHSKDLKIDGVKDIIAVASGKGGVGKSTTAVNLAVSLANRCKLKVGLLDADVYGPSIPIMMKLEGKPQVTPERKMIPIENYGVRCMSMGSLVEEGAALVWRGPMVMKALEQMTRGVSWGTLDVLVVDMPPGTGDAQISISQRLQLSGALIVSTPQDVALMDARRGVKMFSQVNVPILGVLENMSYFKCPNCSESWHIFGKGGAQKTAEEMNMQFLGEIPLEVGIRSGSDEGVPIVVSHPDSVVSKAYGNVAEKVVNRLDELAKQNWGMHLLQYHHPAAVLFKSSASTPAPRNGLFHPYPETSPQNPRDSGFHFPRPRKTHRHYSVLNCWGNETHIPKWPVHAVSFCNGSVVDDGEECVRNVGVSKDVDVATLGNLCVDIVLNVPKLPPKPTDQRKAYLDELSKTPPPKQYWEAGGNCNMAIAAARLGLRCATIGHVGDEIYGKFLLDVLHDEGIDVIGMNENGDEVSGSTEAYETLLCWVLVDPLQRHGFCSRADFSKEPAFSWMRKLSAQAKKGIKQSKILFCNGYGFDELTPSLLESALEYAVDMGTSIFFDPGPRGKTLLSGSADEQRVLDKFLRMSDVLLLTSDEAESLTGIGNPILAGQQLLQEGIRLKWVIVKMGPRGSLLISMSQIACSPAFKVNVIDTVGCGDSYVAAIAFGFLHKMPLVHTLAMANAVGAATAMGCGAGRNVATLEQVLELMKKSDLNEDDRFWMELLNQNLDVEQKTLLSTMVTNGSSRQLSCITPQKVVSEVLPKLEHTRSSPSLPSFSTG
ncbi:OLC1v1007100C1 [Oldenlandia corymbosa var. corymbosa]|uniref:Nucleotide-binding protein-like n=1 Tax=Oldenlandia corymbosa var. corymbosa TaxID=529605 RepID=A0AAV1DK26_OLDCO|nr:OLC1v1007100C1 [Oldenlandia corymbosa var. corymbosa]